MSDNRVSLCSINEDGLFTLPNDGPKRVTLVKHIGSGGTWLAYSCIVEEGDYKKYSIIKEYYPFQTGITAKYERNNSTGELRICVDSIDMYEDEKSKQKENVDRELRINSALYLRKDNVSSYMYEEKLYCTFGDSTYVLVDTSDGRTLKDILYDDGYLNMTVRERIDLAIDFSRRILLAIDYLFKNDYIHGDLKPENIYFSGVDGAENIFLLDFGSVFSRNEYRIDVEKASDEDKKRLASQIIRNDGVGMSSEGYRSRDMITLLSKKQQCSAKNCSVLGATDLLNAINKIDVSVDIYSVMNIFFLMIIGKVYKSSESRISIKKKLGDCSFIMDELIRIMKKNEKSEYNSISEIMNELDILKALLDRRAHPKVLLYGLQNQVKTSGIDEQLFGEIISD